MLFPKIFICVIVANMFSCVSNYRILGVFPFPARSHYFLGSALMRALAEAGHDVTIIAPYKDQEVPSLTKNGSYREIVIADAVEAQKNRMAPNGKPNLQFLRKSKGLNNFFNNLQTIFGPFTEELLNSPEIQKLIQSDEKFDVVIISEIMQKVLRAFAPHFDASLVLFVSSGVMTWYYDEVGNIVLPSIHPVLPVEMPPRMSFLQRLENFIAKIQFVNWMNFNTLRENELIKKYFPSAPSTEEISKNVSLVLVNSHYSTDLAQPLVPKMVKIGGFHVKQAKKLPKDLQEIMDNAKYGVILFSFGTIIDPQMIPPEKLQHVLEELAKRKEIILWKFGGELQGLPKNVIIKKWLPQQDILAHPNTKLFITHSGYLSTIETTYYGVPTVSVPFIVDQMRNAKFLEETGSGVVVDLENFGGETIGKAIEEVISNPNYRNAAKQKSRIMHDRQTKPVDDAIFWVEYIVRHKGAKHLSVPYLDMPLYQVYMLDIIAVIFISSSVVILSLVLVAIKLCKCITNRKSNEKTVPSKKKKN